MSHQPQFDGPDMAQELSDLTSGATGLGREMVEVVGFLDELDQTCTSQLSQLEGVRDNTHSLGEMSASMLTRVEGMASAADDAIEKVQESTQFIAQTGHSSQALAEWVRSVDGDSDSVETLLQGVRNSNTLISDIASQVHILSINAKIEAARAGQAGKGFSIVADSVKDLSEKTSDAAETITETVEKLSMWMAALHKSARETSIQAEAVLSRSQQTDQALNEIHNGMSVLRNDAHELADHAVQSKRAVDNTNAAINAISSSVSEVASCVVEANRRCAHLVDSSESILQHAVALGGTGEDGEMITRVQDIAGQITQAFEKAIAMGQISHRDLFDQSYQPIPGTDPQQVMAPYTHLTDRLLPPIQEPVLEVDSRIVFCAAVDKHGYLPTHNLKFSQKPSNDPVWNAANCRNRRIFDDRVGLKAGTNTKPFLLQVYRRDMGGGTFAMMKDLSAPIHVGGQHWGGVRLAYKI